jgi:hypothetical protein
MRGALQPPVSRALAEFDSPDDVLFRVEMTSPGTAEEPHRLLLAEADRVRLRAGGSQRSARAAAAGGVFA